MPFIDTDIKLDFKDVLIRPKRSTIMSRETVNLHRTFTFRHSRKDYHGIPIVAANMHCIGTVSMAKALGSVDIFTALHKHLDITEIRDLLDLNPGIENRIIVSTGGNPSDHDRLLHILRELPQIRYVCLDVANGYGEFLVNHVRQLREEVPDLTIAAGNVVTSEVVEELISTGVDIVKIGIGPGSVCTTRVKTGVGYPQLSAVMECAQAAHNLNGHIIADGGCAVPGDIAKAFGAGADFVMLGGMLAGHDESGDEMVLDINGHIVSKVFYGTSSAMAMNKYFPKNGLYRAAEGKAVCVPYKGPVINTIRDILGGLRSACSYVGASQLNDLSKLTTFLRVTQQANEVYRGLDVPGLN